MRHVDFLQCSAVSPKLAWALAIAVSCVCVCACGSDDGGPSAGSAGAQSGGGGVNTVPPTAGRAGASGVANGGVATDAQGRGGAGTAGKTSAAGSGSGVAGRAAAGKGASGSIAGSPAKGGAGGVAGRAGMGGITEDECGPIPTDPQQAATPKAVVLYALVEYHTADENEWVGVHATLTVPAKPPAGGVIFVWPGTQTFPGGPTVQPVGEGVLQPVLTWGNSCVPGALFGYSTWWISPVYVNEDANSDLNGCHGGPVITVDVGDRLDLDMRLKGTTWNQKIIDLNSKESTEFSIDLRGQLQQRTLFEIELKTYAKPTEDIIFEDIVLTMRDPEPGACALNNRGTNDYATQSRVSADGLHCCIDRIVLRAEGVPATTKNP